MIKDIADRKECFVSAVMVLHGQAPDKERLKSIQEHLEKHFTDYEIVLVQNSLSGRYNPSEDILNELPAIRYLQLSNAVHRDVALAAGVESAIGDYVVLLSEHDPVEVIAGVVELCQGDKDVVVGVAEKPTTLVYRLARPLVQKLLSQIGYDLPKDATTLRCLSRNAVNAVLHTGRFYHQFFMRVQKTGFGNATYFYKLLPHKSPPIKTLAAGIHDTLHLFVFNSTKPLRWMSLLGFGGSLIAFSFAAYSLLVNVFMNRVVEGWTTIVLFNSFLFMVMFIMLAFFGEYLGRLLYATSDQSDYALAFEKISTVMINSSRINVLHDSTGDRDAAYSVSSMKRAKRDI